MILDFSKQTVTQRFAASHHTGAILFAYVPQKRKLVLNELRLFQQ